MKKLLSLLALVALPLSAQKIKKVEGEYTYHAPENVTLEQARRTALERAMLTALADEFGTVVQQSDFSSVANRDGASSIDFSSFGSTEVKGEWLETIGEPVFDVFYEQGMLVVKAKVAGRAREITSAAIDLQVRVLRNGTEDKYESYDFCPGDELFLSFRSPVDGYLAVYLIDAAGTAYCLLPYRNQTGGICRVRGNRPYLFFSPGHAAPDEAGLVDEYTLTCEGEEEQDQIYIIFSPNPFYKAADRQSEAGELPRELPVDAFRKWLVNCRKHDTGMQSRIRNVSIRRQR